MKLASTAGRRWSVLRRFTIDRDGEVYLTRWYLVSTPWFGVYLHRFDGPDPDADPHDHPWNFVTMVLRGGYDEEALRRHGDVLEVVDCHHRPLVPRRRTLDTRHKVARLWRVPTWTLVVVGRRQREWGFWLDGGAGSWVPWREYLAE